MVKPGRLPCDHPAGWAVRLRDGTKRYVGCLGCAFLKAECLNEINSPSIPTLEPKPKEKEKVEVKKKEEKRKK